MEISGEPEPRGGVIGEPSTSTIDGPSDWVDGRRACGLVAHRHLATRAGKSGRLSDGRVGQAAAGSQGHAERSTGDVGHPSDRSTGAPPPPQRGRSAHEPRDGTAGCKHKETPSSEGGDGGRATATWRRMDRNDQRWGHEEEHPPRRRGAEATLGAEPVDDLISAASVTGGCRTPRVCRGRPTLASAT